MPLHRLFFKQWGGVHAKTGGRELDGRTWDDMLRQPPKQVLEPLEPLLMVSD
jgi:hypothetical protein